MSQNLRAAFIKLDSFIRDRMKLENIPGLTIAVTDKDRLLWSREYGHANLDSKGRVTKRSLFQIGSISKSFASTALLQLVEEGKVDLHKPVKKYLPWFEVKSRFGPITLDHLLSHTAGIITGEERTPEGKTEIWSLRETEATAKPGEMFHYSNIGYKIIGEVISRVTGKRLPRVLQERVIWPLEMSETYPEIRHDLRDKSAVGYWPLHDDKPMKNSPQWVPCTWIESEAADGSICSTSEDMCKYVRMLLNRGRTPDGRLMTDDSYSMLVQKRIGYREKGKTEYYGYGIGSESYHGHLLMGHTGGMPGFISSLHYDLGENVGAFASTNCLKSVDDVTKLAIELVRRARHHEQLQGAENTVLPPKQNLRDYAGTYSSSTRSLDIGENRGGLTVCFGDEWIPLEWQEGDIFYSDHPSLDRFVFSFGRRKGEVVEVTHGEDWFTNGRFKGRRRFDYPKEWDSFTGHFRSHDPWSSNFRVLVVKGSLWMASMSSPGEPLTPVGNRTFRVGADRRSPERLSFSTFVDGKAQIANLSGCEHARTFTP